MLLFSTILDITDTLTKDAFISLVIRWNQTSEYTANIVPGVQWNGERNIRFGTDDLWLAIEEYRNENIIAVRHEKNTEGGIVWDTDFVMNFNEMRMSIRLDRSYNEEALMVDPSFSTPHFITLLIEGGYLKDDSGLPILKTPVMISEDTAELAADVICGAVRYRLPVVFVSRTYDETEPVDIDRLASRLKGVAHVFVQKDYSAGVAIRKLCDSRNEYNGAIGIYYPNQTIGHQKFLNHQYYDSEIKLAEKVIRNVIQYSNAQRIDILYTWTGVNTAILQDRYASKREELAAAYRDSAQNHQEMMDLLQFADEDIKQMKAQLAELSRQNESLTYENQGLRTKLRQSDKTPALYFGEEDELFQGEIKEILLEELNAALTSKKAGTRRADILGDIIRSNGDVQGTAAEKAQKLKTAMVGYKNLSSALKRQLKELGFDISDDGKHYKLVYFGDGRYTITVPKTPSDERSGSNTASIIINKVL